MPFIRCQRDLKLGHLFRPMGGLDAGQYFIGHAVHVAEVKCHLNSWSKVLLAETEQIFLLQVMGAQQHKPHYSCRAPSSQAAWELSASSWPNFWCCQVGCCDLSS